MKTMPTYQTIEFTGTSAKSSDEAVNNAIHRAHQTVKNISWFQIIETRGNVEKGQVHNWQVALKIGFALESSTKK